MALTPFVSVNICISESPRESANTGNTIPIAHALVDKLHDEPDYQQFLRAIGAEPDAFERVTILSELQGAAPPVGLPMLNDIIGVLTVAAPTEDSIDVIRRIVADAAPSGTRFLHSVPCGIPETKFGSRSGSRHTGGLKTGAVEIIPGGVKRILAPTVWATGNQGATVRVAIVDTGVGPHDDLPHPTLSQSLVPGMADCRDHHGHGTYVAGIVLARRNKFDVVGVAPEAELCIAKAMSRDQCEDQWITNAITWAASNHVRVVNVSLVADAYSEPIARAAAHAVAMGCIVCAAAGNTYEGAVLWPAADANCIAVGASTLQDDFCQISAVGPELDFYAPGCGIESTALGGGTISEDGTSASAPHVAGVVTLMLAADSSLSVAALRDRLNKTAVPLNFVKTIGRVSAEAALIP